MDDKGECTNMSHPQMEIAQKKKVNVSTPKDRMNKAVEKQDQALIAWCADTSNNKTRQV